jgi:hypothetical protein
MLNIGAEIIATATGNLEDPLARHAFGFQTVS